jgi:hypothetical protein
MHIFFDSVTDFYRFLPHLTAFYRFLPHFTDSYRYLPIGYSFAAHRTANERQTNGKLSDKCGTKMAISGMKKDFLPNCKIILVGRR